MTCVRSSRIRYYPMGVVHTNEELRRSQFASGGKQRSQPMKYLRPLIAIALLGILVACSTPGRPRSAGDSADSPPGVEDIYILRSLREARSTPDEFCAPSKTGFTAKVQDRYSFKAVVTRAPDGKVVDATVHDAGTLHACFDGVPGVPDANFYAEGVIAGVPATGKGKCTAVAADFPEHGITSLRCFLVLSNLPAPYVGGVLTTNSVASRQPIGVRSDPPGYTQPSIATIRLWRKR
jgi:hypothetical protein